MGQEGHRLPRSGVAASPELPTWGIGACREMKGVLDAEARASRGTEVPGGKEAFCRQSGRNQAGHTSNQFPPGLGDKEGHHGFIGEESEEGVAGCTAGMGARGRGGAVSVNGVVGGGAPQGEPPRPAGGLRKAGGSELRAPSKEALWGPRRSPTPW